MERKHHIKNRNGISAKAFTIPLIAIVSLILVSIVVFIIDINHSNDKLVDLMERSNEYQLDAWNMQASNTILSETCQNYMQMPELPDSSANVGPLIAYVGELGSNRRGPKIVDRFKNYDISADALLCVARASEYSEQIKNVQMHAIAVMASVHPLPTADMPNLAVFSDIELTDEELAMTSAQREEHARMLIAESEYAQKRFFVAENIEACNRLIQEEFNKTSTKTKQHVAVMRDVLWVEIAVVIFMLFLGFVLFYFLLLKPLRGYVRDVTANESIRKPNRIAEMNQLVVAFNDLWHYRNKIEAILRTEAENDALTGLPNRYCMEHDLLRNSENDRSLAVVMFDINFLKETNDTKGHLAGDELIKTAAVCIKECFGTELSNNCYRIGGDEFIALLTDVKNSDIKKHVQKFKLATEREKISVSVGYAYADQAEGSDFTKLIEEADRNMYDEKKQVHKKRT